MELYSHPYKLKSRDVNRFERLRPSQLFELMQEAATEHSELLGAGIREIRTRNLMWVLVRQYVEITRMPRYGEEVMIETWPTKTVHSLYPRFYRILSQSGETLIASSAIWTLADMKERVLVPASRSGVDFGFEARGCEIALPSPIRRFETDRSVDFTVPFSYIDMNGHMNNTRYLDLADNLCPAAQEGREPKRIRVEYAAELLCGREYTLHYAWDGKRFLLNAGDEKSLFRISEEY